MIESLIVHLRNFKKQNNLQDPNVWNGYFLDYCKPHMVRLFRQIDSENYLYLHKLMLCEERDVYPHLHKWPCAVAILDGIYEMSMGYVDDEGNNKMLSKHIVNTSDIYEITNPDALHGIRPVNTSSISAMLRGPEFDKSMLSTGHHKWFDKQPKPGTPVILTYDQKSKFLGEFSKCLA